MQIAFKDILKQKVWTRYEDYVSEGIKQYSSSLTNDIIKGREMRHKIREYMNKNFEIKQIPDDLSDAENSLISGEVVGIDGTMAQHKTISGTMAQIGIVAVNYLNEKIKHAYFISEAEYKEDIDQVTDYLAAHQPEKKVFSNLVMRALLLYRERELGLSDIFKENYKLFHGPLLPFELMSDLGRLRALDCTLDILQKLIENKKCFSIISRSQNDAHMRLGLSLNPGEYFLLKHRDVGSALIYDSNLLAYKDKWRDEDFLRINHFLQQDASVLKIGIIKISRRPYVFQAHEKYFDFAARVIARDAMFQKEKGFPLLIDYADNLCSTFFKASDFNKIIEYQLAREGEFLSEMSEETLRNK
jgi:hypothetical protein